mmetsp:Transcript_13830/g.35536  ORF Transcript_13830/g.35536 Transcript_13830/m.35536 type:complete len:328 (+) Transcript_13830:1210-2193(+)
MAVLLHQPARRLRQEGAREHQDDHGYDAPNAQHEPPRDVLVVHRQPEDEAHEGAEQHAQVDAHLGGADQHAAVRGRRDLADVERVDGQPRAHAKAGHKAPEQQQHKVGRGRHQQRADQEEDRRHHQRAHPPKPVGHGAYRDGTNHRAEGQRPGSPAHLPAAQVHLLPYKCHRRAEHAYVVAEQDGVERRAGGGAQQVPRWLHLAVCPPRRQQTHGCAGLHRVLRDHPARRGWRLRRGAVLCALLQRGGRYHRVGEPRHLTRLARCSCSYRRPCLAACHLLLVKPPTPRALSPVPQIGEALADFSRPRGSSGFLSRTPNDPALLAQCW